MTNMTVVSTGAFVLPVNGAAPALAPVDLTPRGVALAASILHDDLALDPARIVTILESLLSAGALDMDPDTGYRESADDAAEQALAICLDELESDREYFALSDVDASAAVDLDRLLDAGDEVRARQGEAAYQAWLTAQDVPF
jgi:hypothetical protein